MTFSWVTDCKTAKKSMKPDKAEDIFLSYWLQNSWSQWNQTRQRTFAWVTDCKTAKVNETRQGGGHLPELVTAKQLKSMKPDKAEDEPQILDWVATCGVRRTNLRLSSSARAEDVLRMSSACPSHARRTSSACSPHVRKDVLRSQNSV